MQGGRHKKQVAYVTRAVVVAAVAFFLGFYPADSHGQNYSYTHYDVKDGLPSTIVYDITQDTDGFIWFGTENGVSRFDGKNFTNYSTKDGLPDNSVLTVYADKFGRVFFSPFTHPPYYYYKDSIYAVKASPAVLSEMAGISSYYGLKDRVIRSGDNTIYAIDKQGTVTTLASLNPILPPRMLVGMVNDTVMIGHLGDSLYYVTQGHLLPFDIEDTKRYVINYIPGKGPVYNEILPGIAFDPGGRLVNNLFYGFNGSSVFFFSTETGKLQFKFDIQRFSRAFIDNEMNLWITTVGNGVYRFPSLVFRHMSFTKNSTDIFSVGEFNNRIVAGSEFSTYFQLTAGDSSVKYTANDAAHYIARSGNHTSHFTGRNRIYKLLKKDNILYIGADAFTLKLEEGKSPVFRNIFPVKDIDTLGNKLLICTSTETVVLNAPTMEVTDTLLRKRATSGVFYNGDYYIGTYGGLIKIDSKDKSITSLGNIHPALKSRIASIKRGTDNDLWIATSGSGVVRLKDGKAIEVFTMETGLTSDMGTCLLVDSGNVWLGTNKGLNRIMAAGKVPRVLQYTTSNGLAADFINTIYIRDTMIYVGSAAGLTFFNKDLSYTSSVCLLHITRVSKGNDALKKDSVYSFPYRTMNIRVDFTAISFKSAGDNTYYYTMEGLDNGWNQTTNTFINYATLPPGNYTLRIYAVNKFGVTSVTKSVSITVVPPWWQRWWFIAAAVSLITLAILFIYNKNIRSVRRQEENKRKNEARLAALEQQALQAQMNPHFIFNCLNSIQSYILDLDVEGANKYLTAFASMIRQTLDNSSTPLIRVAEEIKYLETYLQLEKLRFKEKFNYTINVDENIDQHGTQIPGMLLQPYIENSLRHGIQHRSDNLGVVLLDIIGDGQGGVVCIIRDNGVGRKKSEEMKSLRHIEYQSKGTHINQKRIDAINNQFKTNIVITTEDITDSNGSVAGTIVKISIPPFYNTEA